MDAQVPIIQPRQCLSVRMESALIVLPCHCENNIYQTIFATYNMLILIMHNNHCEMFLLVSKYYYLIFLCISKNRLYRQSFLDTYERLQAI